MLLDQVKDFLKNPFYLYHLYKDLVYPLHIVGTIPHKTHFHTFRQVYDS